MLSIVGTVIVLLCVVVPFVMEGGSILLLWHPSEMVTIIGAALARSSSVTL